MTQPAVAANHHVVFSYLASLNSCHFLQIRFCRQRLEPRATAQTAKRLQPSRGAELAESRSATESAARPVSSSPRGLRQALKVPAGDFQHSLLLRGTAPTHRNLWCWSSGFGTFPRPSRDFRKQWKTKHEKPHGTGLLTHTRKLNAHKKTAHRTAFLYIQASSDYKMNKFQRSCAIFRKFSQEIFA